MWLAGCTPSSQPTPPIPPTLTQTATPTPSKTTVSVISNENTPTLMITQEIILETPILPTPSEEIKGTLTLLSNPSGANVTIEEVDFLGNTPYLISLLPGDYAVGLTLEGYQIWEQKITISSGETLTISTQLMPIPQTIGTYIDLMNLGGLGNVTELDYLREVVWGSTSQSFIYGVQKGLNLSEAKDWIWSSYNLVTDELVEIPPPTSSINAQTRMALNLCPLTESEWNGSLKCSSLSTLFESTFHNFIAFSPIISDPYSEGQLWIAHTDGSNAQQLADFAPSYVHWSKDESWLVTGRYFPGLAGQRTHFLVSTDGSFIGNLQQMTGVDSFYINGLFPEFSPTKNELLYAGSEKNESLDENDYKLYILDLDTFERRLVTDKFGLFQWAETGEGIYILDGASYPINPLEPSGFNVRETNLYYVDLSQEPPQEYLIASKIPYYPRSDYGMWNWAYSPIFQAIMYVGFKDEPNLGILFLESTEQN